MAGATYPPLTVTPEGVWHTAINELANPKISNDRNIENSRNLRWFL
jgi:hypothetical protein